MSRNPDTSVEVRLEDWVKTLITEQSRETSKEIERLIDKHKVECPVSDLEREIWGNGKKGLSKEMVEMRKDIQIIKKQTESARGFIADILKPVLVAVIIAMIFYFIK